MRAGAHVTSCLERAANRSDGWNQAGCSAEQIGTARSSARLCGRRCMGTALWLLLGLFWSKSNASQHKRFRAHRRQGRTVLRQHMPPLRCCDYCRLCRFDHALPAAFA